MITSSFDDVVALYRAASKIQFERSYFKGEVTSSSFDSMQTLHSGEHEFGRFSELIIDEEEVLPGDKLPDYWRLARFTWILASNSKNRFYENLEEFLKVAGKGELPQYFFIVSTNNSHRDADQTNISQIRTACELIKALSIIADYHDEKNDSPSYNLIFTQHEGDTKSKTTSIKTLIKDTDLRKINISLAIHLSEGSDSVDNHHQAKIHAFKNSIIEFCDHLHAEDRFGRLLRDWDIFLKNYNNNLSTYLSGFSFHKAKKDVATAQISIAEQLSKITSETTGRILAIPLSFAAVIGLIKLNSILEALIVLISLAILSFITTLSITNQKKQLSRLVSSRNITFNSFQGKSSSYPDELNKDIADAKTALEQNEKYLSRTLYWYEVICWLPTFSGFLVIIYLFGPKIGWYKYILLTIAAYFKNSVINN